MKYFKELIETVNRGDLIGRAPDGSVRNVVPCSALYDSFNKCQPFVFSKLNSEEFEYLDCVDQFEVDRWTKEPIPLFDLPFSTISLEMTGGSITRDGFENTVRCLLIEETSPGNYWCLASGFSKTLGRNMVGYIDPRTPGLAPLLNRLKTDAVGQEETSQKIQIGTGKYKSARWVKRIVHVRPKREVLSKSEPSGRIIDWSHRWLVRGHWRKLESGIGKNRAGDYCVQGFTWVKEFEKGPDSAPLIKKVRVVDALETPEIISA